MHCYALCVSVENCMCPVCVCVCVCVSVAILAQRRLAGVPAAARSARRGFAMTHPECPPPPDGPPTTGSLVWNAVQMAEQAYHVAVMRRDTIRMVMAQAENDVMEANRFYHELVQLQRRFIDDIQNRNLDNGQ